MDGRRRDGGFPRSSHLDNGSWRVESDERGRVERGPLPPSAFAFFALPVNDQQLFLLSVPVAVHILCNRRDPQDSQLGVDQSPYKSPTRGDNVLVDVLYMINIQKENRR